MQQVNEKHYEKYLNERGLQKSFNFYCPDYHKEQLTFTYQEVWSCGSGNIKALKAGGDFFIYKDEAHA